MIGGMLSNSVMADEHTMKFVRNGGVAVYQAVDVTATLGSSWSAGGRRQEQEAPEGGRHQEQGRQQKQEERQRRAHCCAAFGREWKEDQH